MVKRLHVDNFRCLINFEVKLDELNLFLGANGSGKTSVLDALRRLQSLIARDARVDEVFRTDDLPSCRTATSSASNSTWRRMTARISIGSASNTTRTDDG